MLSTYARALLCFCFTFLLSSTGLAQKVLYDAKLEKFEALFDKYKYKNDSSTTYQLMEGLAKKIFDLANISKDGMAREKGNSIGLILSKEFAEQNNGMIWVETEQGNGSAFHFTVSLASPQLLQMA